MLPRVHLLLSALAHAVPEAFFSEKSCPVKGHPDMKDEAMSYLAYSAIAADMIFAFPVYETIFPLPCTVFPLS